MQPTSLIQLQPRNFEIHFPVADRKRQMAELSQATRLLHESPIADLWDEALSKTIGEVEVLITGWGSQMIDGDLHRQMPKLKLIAHLAGTVKNHISLDVVDSGVRVVNAAAANAQPVADFTLAHILLFLKGVDNWRSRYKTLRSRISTRTDPLQHRVGNRNRTIGVVGASRIGILVIDLAQRHGISVLVCDPYWSEQSIASLGAEKVSMDDLLQRSDVVTLHQPLLPETEKSFSSREFEKMRDGALLINTARGQIVDTKALETAMADGRLHAVLDVTDPEPLNDDSPLWDMENVKLSPHTAGAFGREVSDLTDLVLDQIACFARGETLTHEVNAQDWRQSA